MKLTAGSRIVFVNGERHYFLSCVLIGSNLETKINDAGIILGMGSANGGGGGVDVIMLFRLIGWAHT